MNRPPFKPAPSHFPHPLRGFFTWIGHGLKFVLGGFLSWIYHHLLLNLAHGFRLTFGNWWPYILVLLAVVVGALAGLYIFRRRTRFIQMQGSSRLARTPLEDPAELEQLAEAAAKINDFDTAVRLWFRAGVLRLTMHGLVTNGSTRTDAQLVREIPSRTLADLAGRHEQIVYARQSATSVDAQSAREGWRIIVNEAARSTVAS